LHGERLCVGGRVEHLNVANLVLVAGRSHPYETPGVDLNESFPAVVSALEHDRLAELTELASQPVAKIERVSLRIAGKPVGVDGFRGRPNLRRCDAGGEGRSGPVGRSR
jgi:hypothetical protein